MIKIILNILQVIICLFFFSSAYAEKAPWKEHIIKFDSNIVVNDDASITVTEKFRVYANDELIKHGVLRTLPLSIKDSNGHSRDTKYLVLEVEKNAKPTPYHIETKNKKLYVYIGDKNKTLKPGYYNFTLKYQVQNAIGFVNNWDELAWNVTGSDWNVPILNVKAKIIIPKDRNFEHYRGHLDTEHKNGVDYTVNKPTSNEIIFNAKYLPPNSALDVGVAWLEGKVKRPPTFMDEVKETIRKIIHFNWEQQAAYKTNTTNGT